MAKRNKSGKQQVLVRLRRKGNPLALLVGMQADAATLEKNMEVPQMLKVELLCDPAIILLGISPKATKKVIRRDTCTPVFRGAMSTIAKVGKEPRCTMIDE